MSIDKNIGASGRVHRGYSMDTQRDAYENVITLIQIGMFTFSVVGGQVGVYSGCNIERH